MTPLAVIDLDIPESGRKGRAFLERELLRATTLDDLERDFAACFTEPDDEARMHLIEQLFEKSEAVHVSVHPGESSPPEYHAYLRDPAAPEARLFACVLAPFSVVRELLTDPPHVLFETATFQAMLGDVSPTAMVEAVEAWARRVWPALDLPKFIVWPWPAAGHIDPQKSDPRGGPGLVV